MEVQVLRRIQQRWEVERRAILAAWAKSLKVRSQQREEMELYIRNIKAFVKSERVEWIRQTHQLVRDKQVLQEQLDAKREARARDESKLEYDLTAARGENARLREQVDTLKSMAEAQRRDTAGADDAARLDWELEKRELVAEINMLREGGSGGGTGGYSAEEYSALERECRRLRAENNALANDVAVKNRDIQALVAEMRKKDQQHRADKKRLVTEMRQELAALANQGLAAGAGGGAAAGTS